MLDVYCDQRKAAEAAYDLAANYGLPVFACLPDKRPATPNGFKDASTDLDELDGQFVGERLVGIPTGKASKLFVLDIDPAGQEWYRENFESLKCGYVQQTRRGFHLYFRYPADVEIRNSAGKIAPGVDVRGEGGYVIAWSAEGLPGVGSWEDINAAPDWLLDGLVRPKPRPIAPKSNGALPEGRRNDSMARIAGQMQRIGFSPERLTAALLGINATECKPPLPEAEVQAVAKSIARYPPLHAAGDQDAVTVADFYAYLPMHAYIFVPSRDLWPASSVNARVANSPAGKPAEWLDVNQSVEQMTWAPGQPMVIKDRLIANGGWIDRSGCQCFNQYRGPTIRHGDPSGVGPWLKHGRLLFGDDLDHILKWLAHRVQRPGEKINHALVLGGGQGIGKDTLLEPVKHAVGGWNCHEVSPAHLVGRFNGFVKSVILRVSEARDLGDVDRFAFYDHMKVYTAAPPDVLRCDEKNLREYAVPNVCGVIITSNHKSDGIYLPADDRRHFVAWSDLAKEDFDESYWRGLWGWYDAGGFETVVGYLAALDLTGFDPKAPPPKTPAFYDIVDASRAPEDADLADVIDACENPKALTIATLLNTSSRINSGFHDWLSDRKNRRVIPHRLETADYVPVRNGTSKDGLWKIDGKRQAVYAMKTLSIRDRLSAALQLLDLSSR